MHVFNVAIGQPEIIDGINGVLMPCVDQVLVKFSKMWQNAKLGREGTGTRLQNDMPNQAKIGRMFHRSILAHHQIDWVCEKLLADPLMADGYNAIGISQGGLLIRLQRKQ